MTIQCRSILKTAIYLVAAVILFVMGPPFGKAALHAFTSDATIRDWKSEFERLDQIFPRVHSNEERRLEIIHKMRQRGLRIDEGVDESIDHKITPYTIYVHLCRQWNELFGS